MDEFLEYSWLIPVIPFLGASLLGILLVSFDRTMNRLSKPVFAISLGSTSLSALLSYFLLFYEFNHQNNPYVFDLDQILSVIPIHITFFADIFSAAGLSISSTVILLLMYVIHKQNYRKKGYVRNFVLTGFATSFLFAFVLTYPISSIFN